AMQGGIREIALDLVTASGARLPVLVNATLRRAADGAPLAVRMTVFDATDRRRYERELLHERRRAQQAAARVRALQQATEELVAVPTVAGVAAAVVGAATTHFGAHDGALWLLDDAHAVLERVGAAADRLPRRLDAAGASPHAEALARGAPVVLAAHGEAAARFPELAEALCGDGRAVVVAPVAAGGRPLGALAFRFAGDGVFLDELPVLATLARQAGQALERARLYEQERATALTLQRSLLAGDLPADPRCQITTRYRPGAEALEVGGDWYDAFRVGADKLGVLVGDVVGRGIEAASAMGQLRSAARAIAGGDIGPARLLQRLDGFVERVPAARMATVVYAEVDLAACRVVFACAGHPPPVVLPPGDEAPQVLWEGRSAPLGASVRGRHRREDAVVVPRGSRLLLYTDGLVERRDALFDEGLAALVAALARSRARPLATMVDGVLGSLVDESAGRDDVCVLCVSVGAPAAFDRAVHADPTALAPLREDLRAWLDAHGVGGEDRDAVVLACSEAVGNAVEHGYRGDGAGLVTVRAVRDDAGLRLGVGDRGSWREPRPGGLRGRGLLLMRRVMDEVRIDRDGGTQVTMYRRVGR
ncbi:MAG TPA: SpoIIE family protein phosphatase, partial [Pilimelia sp.]|nr:SpoIIE family protein phosphatase [Pilimelia sp.]